MKKFILRKKGQTNPIGKYKTKDRAAEAMMAFIDLRARGDHGIEESLTPFDFTLEEIEEEPNKLIPSYRKAMEYLGLNYDSVWHPRSKHIDALIALDKLFIIAEAWNKIDDFVPDFSNTIQRKYYPWFVYSNDVKRFIYRNANCTTTHTGASANFGPRICFKSAERAEQFGKMFTYLYNQVYL